MVAFLNSYVRDESGAAAAEYALILAVVCVGILVAIKALGTNITAAVTSAATAVTGN
jgi:pilus assembly protein Flp/PilA